MRAFLINAITNSIRPCFLINRKINQRQQFPLKLSACTAEIYMLILVGFFYRWPFFFCGNHCANLIDYKGQYFYTETDKR